MTKVVRKRKSMAAIFLEKQQIPLPFGLQNKRFVMVDNEKNVQACNLFSFSIKEKSMESSEREE